MELTTMEKKMIPLYVNQIRLKRRTIDDVPKKLQPAVIAACEELGLPYKAEEPKAVEEPKSDEPQGEPEIVHDEGAGKDQIADLQGGETKYT